MPSVYGEREERFKELLPEITSDEQHLLTLVKEVETTYKKGQRSVIIFFETRAQMEDAYSSDYFTKSLEFKQNNFIKLHTEITKLERESRIQKASTAGYVTFATRDFGRGTDFVCHDKTVEEQGGVHIITTFLPLEKSEYIQIQGRTARMSKKGSFKAVLNMRQLEEFGITPQMKENAIALNTLSAINTMLDKQREIKFDKVYKDKTSYMRESEKWNQAAYAFRDALIGKDVKAVKQFLLDNNQGKEFVDNVSRTFITIDRTGSMSNTLDGVKNKIKLLIEQVSKLLVDNGLKKDQVEIAISFYGNYNCSTRGDTTGSIYGKLFESSPFTSKAKELVDFLKPAKVDGGCGREAAEMGLNHANQILDKEGSDYIDQIILIGDIPPNTPEECTSRQNSFRSRWSGMGMPVIDNSNVQISRLQAHNVPIYSFYVYNNNANEQAYNSMSTKTGGKAHYLDVNSEDGATNLLHVLAQRILTKVGEKNSKPELVEQYRKQNKVTFTA